MNYTCSFTALTAGIFLFGLVGCQKAAEGPVAQAGLCRPEAAAALTGKARLSDAEAMRLTGATLVRQIEPGDGVTMDFRQERVTIETDAKTGRITRAMCG